MPGGENKENPRSGLSASRLKFKSGISRRKVEFTAHFNRLSRGTTWNCLRLNYVSKTTRAKKSELCWSNAESHEFLLVTQVYLLMTVQQTWCDLLAYWQVANGSEPSSDSAVLLHGSDCNNWHICTRSINRAVYLAAAGTESRCICRSSMRSLDSFSLPNSFQSHYGPGVDTASNRNEYQGYSGGLQSWWCVRLTTSPPSVSQFSRKCWLSISHNPVGFHGLLQR
jgi:hypothetical protein